MKHKHKRSGGGRETNLIGRRMGKPIAKRIVPFEDHPEGPKIGWLRDDPPLTREDLQRSIDVMRDTKVPPRDGWSPE